MVRAAAAAAAIALTLLWVAAAAAAPTTADQKLAADTAEWVAHVLHVPTTTRPLRALDAHDLVYPWGAQVRCDGTTIDYDSRIRFIDDAGIPDWAAGALLLHETLHLAGGRLERGCPADRWIEEGVTEAVANDLYPAWSKRFTGLAETADPVYEYANQVRAIRGWSAVYTGTPRKPNTRAARLARRQLLLSDDATRAEMIQSTHLTGSIG